jgi:hypothetical protein
MAVIFDDTEAAVGPSIYDHRTCDQRHDAQLQALKLEVELQGKYISRLSSRLASLEAKLASWEGDS